MSGSNTQFDTTASQFMSKARPTSRPRASITGEPELPPVMSRSARKFTGTVPRRLSASRSEEHTSELQSLMRISYAVFCLKKKKHSINHTQQYQYLKPRTTYQNNKTILIRT